MSGRRPSPGGGGLYARLYGRHYERETLWDFIRSPIDASLDVLGQLATAEPDVLSKSSFYKVTLEPQGCNIVKVRLLGASETINRELG